MRERPVFLERGNYRQRRVMDAARILPFAGVAVFLFPLLWAARAGTVRGAIYVFAVWAALIALAFVISHRLRRDDATVPPEPDEDS